MQGNILELIRTRRSIRRFLPEEVPQEVIESLAEAARWAPSPTNKPAFELIVVRNQEIKTKMVEAVTEQLDNLEKELPHEDAVQALRSYQRFICFFQQAPVVIAVTCRIRASLLSTMRGGSPSAQDQAAALSSAGAAVQNILLTAHSLGYGTCWMTGPLLAEEALAQILGVERPARLLALIPLGRPAEQPVPPKRKELDQIMKVVD